MPFHRPAVQCAFDVMTACDAAYKSEKDKRDCKEGARDAHLLDGQWYGGKPYEDGFVTTLHYCSYPSYYPSYYW